VNFEVGIDRKFTFRLLDVSLLVISQGGVELLSIQFVLT